MLFVFRRKLVFYSFSYELWSHFTRPCAQYRLKWWTCDICAFKICCFIYLWQLPQKTMAHNIMLFLMGSKDDVWMVHLANEWMIPDNWIVAMLNIIVLHPLFIINHLIAFRFISMQFIRNYKNWQIIQGAQNVPSTKVQSPLWRHVNVELIRHLIRGLEM